MNNFTAIARSVLFAALLTAGTAHAQSAPVINEGDDHAPRMELDLQGLDLTTPQGLTTARHRVANAARAVCTSTTDVDGTHQERSACVLSARAQGNQRLQVLQEQAMAKAATRTLALQSTAKAH